MLRTVSCHCHVSDLALVVGWTEDDMHRMADNTKSKDLFVVAMICEIQQPGPFEV